jgi:hypothetical protein
MMFRPIRRFKQQRPEKTDFQPKLENIKHRTNAIVLAEEGNLNSEIRQRHRWQNWGVNERNGLKTDVKT